MDVIQNHARDRSANYAGYWGGTVEKCNCTSQLPLGKPVRQVKIHSGDKTSLSDPKQESRKIQMGSCVHEASQNRHNSPTDQYPGNPDASAELVQQEIARYLKYEIAPEEYARHQPELLARESQLLIHR